MATHLEESFGKTFMNDVLAWVSFNFGINDLFAPADIEIWLEDNAKDYGYVKEDDSNGI